METFAVMHTRSLLLKICSVLDEHERQHIKRKIAPLHPELKRYISILISEKEVEKLQQKEALEFIIASLQEYYIMTDEVKNKLLKAYLFAYLSPRLSEATELLEKYMLPVPEQINFWLDKFPWYWAEYTFLNIFSGDIEQSIKDTNKSQISILIGESVGNELYYSYITRKMYFLTTVSPGIPLEKRDIKVYKNVLQGIYEYLKRSSVRLTPLSLKIVSTYFLIEAFTFSRDFIINWHEPVVSHLLEVINLMIDKNMYKQPIILLSDLMLITFPHIANFDFSVINEIRNIILKVWHLLQVKETQQPEFILEHFAFFGAMWLLNYGFVAESTELTSKLRSLPQTQWYILHFFLKAFLDGDLSQLDDRLEMYQFESEHNKAIYVARYIIQIISALEKGRKTDVKDACFSFYQWSRRNKIVQELAKFFRRFANATVKDYTNPYFWHFMLKDLMKIYYNQPLLSNIEFYLPISLYLYYKANPELTPQQALRRYWERKKKWQNEAMCDGDDSALEEIMNLFISIKNLTLAYLNGNDK